MKLIIGKSGKTSLIISEFLLEDDTYFITEYSSINGIKSITRKELGRDFPEDKESYFRFIRDCDLTKLNSFVLTNRIRNKTIYTDIDLLSKHTLKEIEHFEFMNNVELVISVESRKEEELKIVTI